MNKAIFIILLLCPLLLLAQNSEWTAVNNGLNNLNTHVITVSPNDPDVLYCGAENGLYRSENAGEQWSEVLVGLRVKDIWVSDDGQTILVVRGAGSRSDGLWVSRDRGGRFDVMTWLMYPTALAVDPDDPNHIFIGSERNGFRYTTDGQNWAEENQGLPDAVINHLDVKTADNVTEIFASTQQGLYRNQIANVMEWDNINPAGNLPVMQTAFSNEDEEGIWAGTGDVSDSDGIWYSEDFGANWDVQVWAHEVMAVASTLDRVVFGSNEIGVHESIDNGDHWTHLEEGWRDYEITDLEIVETDEATTIYCSTAGSGVVRYIMVDEPQDRPPSRFNLLFPAQQAIVDSTKFPCQWEESIDPDEDVVSYSFYLQSGDNIYSLENLERRSVVVHLDSLHIDLNQNAECTWWVVAHAGELSRECNDRFTFTYLADQPPAVFNLLTPEDDDTVTTREAIFSWEAALDPDENDRVTYEWHIRIGNSEEIWDDLDTTGITVDLTELDIEMIEDSLITWWVVATSDTFEVRCTEDFSLRFIPSRIDPGPQIQPEGFRLSAIYPNPFNAQTTIEYQLPLALNVRLRLYDLKGRLIEEFDQGVVPAGTHSVQLDGNALGAGLYLVELSGGGWSRQAKLTLVK